MTQEDVASLRAAGLDDEEVLEATITCARFNYMCRLADALGAELDLPVRDSELDRELAARGVVGNPQAPVT